MVVLLEDLQWVDPASWEYLVEVFLGNKAQGGVPAAEDGGGNTKEPNGLFILAAARPDWQPPQQLSELFKTSLPNVIARSSLPRAERRALGDDLHHEVASIPSSNVIDIENWGISIPLSPLTDQASRELAQEIFKRVPDVPGQVIDLLVERSEGVPYYTEEMVNWFIDHAILDAHSDPWRFYPDRLKEQPLPATLHHLLLTRLSSLSATERSALQRGAIFGRRFWTGGVEALGVPGGAETLGHLQPRGFVEAQPESSFQGETEWSFHQSLLQEVTYASVLKRERTSLHKVAAEWLEKQAAQAGRLDEFAGLLGEHCEKAGDLDAAADWYLRAGLRAFGQGAPREALGFYTRALDLLPPVDRERRWQALLGKLDCHSILSLAEPWKVDIAAFLELAHAFGDDDHLAQAYLSQAMFGVYNEAEPVAYNQAANEALAAARRCGNEAIEADALSLIALARATRADKPSTIQNIEAAMHIARRLGDEAVLAIVLFRAAYCYANLGDFAKAYPLQTEQVALDHRLGRRGREASGLGNLGNSFMIIGSYKQARALFEQAMLILEALGNRRNWAFYQADVGETYLQSGDLRKARSLLEGALEQLRLFQDVQGMIFTLNLLGLVLLGIGDVSGASRCYTELHQLALEKGLHPLVCEAAAGLAASAAAQGNFEQARTSVQESWDYLKNHGWAAMENPATAYRNCSEVFEALGEGASAREALESGHQALMDKADAIDKPDWRQSFLENVPENRALMEMWEREKN